MIYLLKEDGAHFHEDSLRLYDPTEDIYFQVPDEWEFVVDDNNPSFSLLFWIRSSNSNFRRKLEDINQEFKSVEHRLSEQIESSDSKTKSNLELMYAEINKLKFSTQVLFQQLTKIYRNQSAPDAFGPGNDEEEGHLSPDPLEPILHVQNSMEGPYRSESSGNQGIDIALMYSEPLVRRDEYGIISLGEPVDFEDECTKVLDILRKKEKRINVYFEIATVRNLVNVLSLSPTILHVICHGDFNKQKNQFFLCFEENGELFELYSEDLKVRLQEVNFSTQLVFINACHSEAVARVFIDAGVPCVVAVNSELKIEDSIAQRFSESFYWQLFEGKTVEEAFRHARAAIAGKDVYTCCCAHSHKADCEWYKLVKNEGCDKAHNAHTPTCTDCYNKFGNKFEHKENCMWAIDFLTCVCGHDEIPQGTLHACCCSPELPHNEVMKFKLICRDEKFGKQVLFRYKDKGEVNIRSTHSNPERKFSTMKVTGRNRETYEVFNFLTTKEVKVVNLHGLEGVGKTTLAKQVANYLVERGFFRDKISILMLERTPSTTYFRANLFKEITGSYDLKTFCESIGMARMLFVLMKCDTLIQDSYDQFRQDLAFILEHSPNVKFLIVTNKRVELSIGESNVLMKELKKIDAAKLLVKNAYMYLPWDLRNAYNLVQHEVFDLISLTPHGVWSLSERLKNNKTLDEIEHELTTEKEKNNDTSISESDETLRKILKNLCDNYYDVYQIIVITCLFPGGLSFLDLEELASLGRISTNWKELLYAFLRTKSLCNQYLSQMPEDQQTIPFEEKYKLIQQTLEDKNVKKIGREDFKADNYIWVNINKDPLTGEVWFVPTQFIIKFTERNLVQCCSHYTFKKLEYMALLSMGLIDKIKKVYGYHEKLMEFSAVSTYGLWRLKSPELGLTNPENRVKYLDGPEYDFEKLKTWFSCHESNFFSCFDLEGLNRIMSDKNLKIGQIIEVMEILCLSIPTIFKIVSIRESGAMEAARKAEQLTKKIGEENSRVLMLKIKIGLFIVSLHMGAKSDIPENFSLAKIQLKLAQEDERKIQDDVFSPIMSGLIAFTHAFYFYKAFKNNCLNAKEYPNKLAAYQQVNNLLKKTSVAVDVLGPENDETLRVVRAKITLLLYKARPNRWNVEKKNIEDMRDAIIALTDYKSPRLLMKAHYLYACLKLEIERRKMTLKPQDNSVDSIKTLTNRLVEIKYLHLIKTALEIAKRIKDKVYETKIKRKIDEINMEIRHRYFNVIAIMRACPMIDVKENPDTNTTEIIPIGFPIRIASVFKYDLMESLAASNKVLCMKFGVLSRKEFIDSVHSGCRVLQLNCNYTEDGYICLEGPNGTVDRVSFKEIRDIFNPKLCSPNKTGESTPTITVSECSKMTSLTEDANFTCKLLEKQQKIIESQGKSGSSPTNNNQVEVRDPMNTSTGSQMGDTTHLENTKVVDVLILGSKNSQKLTELFISLKIPHIIAFEFNDNEKNFRHKLCENECIDYFSLYFYQELIAQKTVFDAYDIACSKVFDYIGEKYFDGKPRSYVSQIIGNGPLLFPHDTDHSEVLFGPGRFPLAVGDLEDISNTTSPTNIEKLYLPFTGRCVDFYQVMKKITENRGFLEITGPHGLGKSTFVLHLGYYLLGRNLFPDGIFYIPVKYLKRKSHLGYQFKDLVKDTLGLDIQYGFKSCLKGKNMLIIFDDFDLFYSKDASFCKLFFRALKDCNIPCICVTTCQRISDESMRKSQRSSASSHNTVEPYNEKKEEIKRELFKQDMLWELTDLTEDELALTLHAIIKDEEDTNSISIEELRALPVIHQAQGNPKFIIDQLLEGNIQVRNKTAQIKQFYKEHIDFEEHYMQSREIEAAMTPYSFSRNPSHQTDSSNTSLRGYGEVELSHQQSVPARRGSLLVNMSVEELSDLHKSKSYRYENPESQELPITKTSSGSFLQPKKT